jgi:hypothetical protein
MPRLPRPDPSGPWGCKGKTGRRAPAAHLDIVVFLGGAQGNLLVGEVGNLHEQALQASSASWRSSASRSLMRPETSFMRAISPCTWLLSRVRPMRAETWLRSALRLSASCSRRAGELVEDHEKGTDRARRRAVAGAAPLRRSWSRRYLRSSMDSPPLPENAKQVLLAPHPPLRQPHSNRVSFTPRS